MPDRTTASHLGFYGEFGVSPVRQDISDFQSHLQRRRGLYRQLGLLPTHFQNADVCEVGPGSGFNSLYVGQCKPNRYVLVDGNPTGISDMKKLFADYAFMANVDIRHSPIETFQPDFPFDIVLCEGVMSGVPNPEEVLARLAALIKPGGILVTSCVDHLSHYAETVRRLIAQRAVPVDMPLIEKAQALVPLFKPHLDRLGFVSRRHDDWVIDNLLHPASIIPLVNIPETIVLLASSFQYFGASPNYGTDWRWYKSLVGDNWDFNLPAITQYWSLCHNLMDHRFVWADADPVQNQRLYGLCTRARAAVASFEKTRDSARIADFKAHHAGIVEIMRASSAETAEALAEGGQLATADQIDPMAVAEAPHFGALFGRGQQYISFVKEFPL
jgi:SAM-dependent methyltransferase